MKKEVMIKITLTDDNITLDGENLQKLTEDDKVRDHLLNFYLKLYNKYIQ